jgi:hypothetical protein
MAVCVVLLSASWRIKVLVRYAVSIMAVAQGV